MVDAALLAVSALGLLQNAHSAEKQARGAKRSRAQQEQAQRKNEAAAIGQAREAEQAENRARQRQPDLSVLLDEETRRRGNAASIDVDRLLLGRPAALGF